ncbi:hypothetical protein JTB14_025798 [Gonioctena quinquepunctata]|nr:hypothetical protein JTB14_025798 [Gonioctena quinquepunctata]
MDQKLPICAVICAILFLIETCDTTKTIVKKKFIPKKIICEPDRLCTNTTLYPKGAIKKLLQKNKKKYAHLSGSVIKPTDEMIPQVRSEYIDSNVCRTRQISKRPLVAFDAKMKQKFIVNVEGYQQIVTYETCVDENSACFGNDHWPNDFQTFCKQAYSMVRLVAVNHSGKLEYAYFPVPSNCVCAYKKLGPDIDKSSKSLDDGR